MNIHREIAAELLQKLHVLTAKTPEIIGRKFTKFIHDVAALLPFNLLKAASRLANPLTNARATSKGHFWHHLRTVIYQVNNPFHPSTSPVILVKIGPLDSEIPVLERRLLKDIIMMFFCNLLEN